MKRFLALLCFCASLTSVALADSPAGNGSTSMPTAAQGSPNSYQNAWPMFFGPGGIPYGALQYLASAPASCVVLSSTPLTWGVALVNTSSSALTATLSLYNDATATTGCNVTNQRYSIVLGASQFVIVPVGVFYGWNTGLALSLSAGLSNNVLVYYL